MWRNKQNSRREDLVACSVKSINLKHTTQICIMIFFMTIATCENFVNKNCSMLSHLKIKHLNVIYIFL